MKTESLRDMFAMSAVEGILGSGQRYIVSDPHSDLAKHSYDIADAMMAHRNKEKRDHELIELHEALEKAERTADVLRNMNAPDFAARVALEQIWDFLRADNQTRAMTILRAWKSDVLKVINSD